LARELLTGLRERGLKVTRPILCVIDGAKALRRAILDVFDHPVIARCQQHKIRNVRDRLPQRLQGRWSVACAPLGTPRPRWTPKPSWRRWRASWTRPTRALRPACARGWPRR
jgi:transposase-like protein